MVLKSTEVLMDQIEDGRAEIPGDRVAGPRPPKPYDPADPEDRRRVIASAIASQRAEGLEPDRESLADLE